MFHSDQYYRYYIMLKYFLDNKFTSYHESFDTWQDAIVASCAALEKQGVVDACYSKAIIECVEKYGPYIVIAPNIAMPHSTENALGVNKTGIGFMKVEKPVSFDDNDEEKSAQLFFTLAACNHEEHLNNMMKLSEMLMDDDLVADLVKVTNDEELLALSKKYAEIV